MMVPPLYLDGLQGMIIGAVNGVHITSDTPLDPSQWENGQAWIWPVRKRLCVVIAQPHWSRIACLKSSGYTWYIRSGNIGNMSSNCTMWTIR